MKWLDSSIADPGKFWTITKYYALETESGGSGAKAPDMKKNHNGNE